MKSTTNETSGKREAERKKGRSKRRKLAQGANMIVAAVAKAADEIWGDNTEGGRAVRRPRVESRKAAQKVAVVY